MDLTPLIQEVQSAAGDGSPGAHVRLLRAIQKLNLAAETPTETMLRITYQPVQNGTIRLAVELGLPGAVAARDGESITAAELSQLTGASAILISRILRVLVAMGVCSETGEDEYRANSLTKELANSCFEGGTRYLYDSFIATAPKVIQFMHETAFQNPDAIAPYEYAVGEEHWKHLSKQPALQMNMINYMAGRRKGATRWVDVFPVSSVIDCTRLSKDDVLLIDIGGNQGHDLAIFQQRYPDLPGQLVLQDVPGVIEKVRGKLEGIEAIGYNFFTPQPIRGAHIYYFRAIMHDWPDSACEVILTNTINAMTPGVSRLLIFDFVLPSTGVELQPALLDMMMLHMSAGMERTEKQWRNLIEGVGLSIMKIWRADGAAKSEAVIECMVTEQTNRSNL